MQKVGQSSLTAVASTAVAARVAARAASSVAAVAAVAVEARVAGDAAVALAATATLAATAVLPNAAALVRLRTEAVDGSVAPGRVRIVPVVIGAIDQTLVMRDVVTVETSGDVSVELPTGVACDFYFTPTGDGGPGYLIGRLTVSSSGEFGTLVREAAGRATGADTRVTVAGTMTGRQAGPPASPVYLTATAAAIARDGHVVVPSRRRLTLAAESGAYSVSLPVSADLYTPAGDAARVRLLLNTKRVGAADATVPAGANLAFRVSAAAVEIS